MENEEKTTFGNLIRARREKIGLKVFELAKKVDISSEYITKIELNNKLPSPELFLKILRVLKVDLTLFRRLRELYYNKRYAEFQRVDRLFEQERARMQEELGVKMGTKRFGSSYATSSSISHAFKKK